MLSHGYIENDFEVHEWAAPEFVEQVPSGLLESVADPTSDRHEPELNRGGRVMAHCRSGARSALATLIPKDLGYEKAANRDGGITPWQEAGGPVAEHHEGIEES